ncbi:lytic transglycosylase domain-containing protein [Treponema sp.]|uniref:lytic transglycosylase domain-containing protein n=1 Tax=Treponema sp. TaxID=166 RepID=UPI00388E5F4D
MRQSFFFITVFIVFFNFSVPLFAELEKVELEELPPAEEYYIDDSPLHQILKLFDEEDYERQKKFLEEKQRKIIKKTGDIEIPEQKYAQNMIHEYIARYMTNFGKQNLYKILDNGEFYRLYIRSELKKQKMPLALEYLPLVESEYNEKAVSRSGAKGLWQFMENSMSPFLKKNEWFDERLDPYKSTRAALLKLQDNYNVFKDWPLAIGAYNCGLGAMRRALKKSPVKSFWYLAEHNLIPSETINYVPKLLAITELAENFSEYKIELPELTSSQFYADFDYITTKNKISLSYLENQLRLTEGTLKKLNPELLTNTTPPSEYKLRLPMNMKKAAEDILNFSF